MTENNLTEKIKGSVKEVAGQVVGDENLEAEGQAQQDKARKNETAEAKEAEAAQDRQDARKEEAVQRANQD